MREIILLVSLLFFCQGSFASNYATSNHPLASSARLELYIGDPDSNGLLVYASQALSLTGNVEFNASLDAEGNGTLHVDKSSFTLEAITPTLIEVAGLGSITLQASELQLQLVNTTVDVANNNFVFDRSLPNRGPDLSLVNVFGVTGGAYSFTNPTGLLQNIIPNGYTLDFGSNPYFVFLSTLRRPTFGTIDTGPGLLLNRGEINVGDPTFQLDFNLVDSLQVKARFFAEMHFAEIPETSTLFLSGIAGVGLVAAIMARQRHRA